MAAWLPSCCLKKSPILTLVLPAAALGHLLVEILCCAAADERLQVYLFHHFPTVARLRAAIDAPRRGRCHTSTMRQTAFFQQLSCAPRCMPSFCSSGPLQIRPALRWNDMVKIDNWNGRYFVTQTPQKPSYNNKKKSWTPLADHRYHVFHPRTV